MTMQGLASRRLAVEILLKVEQESAFANQALTNAFKKNTLQERDRAFVTYIVQGTLRHQIELDEQLARFSKQKLAKMSPPLRAVLRSALFQLIHMEDMPPSAVINTSVEIARKTGHEGSARFVNAVLRTFERTRAAGSTPNSVDANYENKDKSENKDNSFSAAKNNSASAAMKNSESTKQRSPSRNTRKPKTGSAVQKQDAGSIANPKTGLSGTNDEMEKWDAGNDGANALARRYSMPIWIVARWLSRYELDECIRLLEHSQTIPLLTLRCSELSISTEGLKSIFESKGMIVSRSALVPTCIDIISRGPLSGPVSKLPGYEDGLFCVQDDASALVSIIVDPKPGQTIVDLCAAPGGKSIHLGELMENKGRVIAVDSNAKRLCLLANERRRMGLKNIETIVRDGREFEPNGPCDAVLVDAPCSGTGVLNRRSDLRQNRKEADLESLIKIQRELMEQAASYLKPGGILVYSTCSIEPDENEENLENFLQAHPEFKTEPLTGYFSKEILEQWSAENHWQETLEQLQNGRIQLLPSRHGCSGFFICRLQRES